MRYLAIALLTCVIGCAPQEPTTGKLWMELYPKGSLVEHKLGIKGTVTYHALEGCSVHYVDNLGQVQTDYWQYSEIKQ